jgi:membrane protein required for colicin V production
MDFPLQPYDFFMALVLCWCIIFGAWKGLAWQVAALASIFVSALVASRLGGPLAPYFSKQEPWNRFLAMLVVYLVTSLLIWLGFQLVAGFINKLQLKEFDRQLGALFGGAKGVLWCLVITFFTVMLSEPARQTILRSRSGHFMAVLIERATPILPQEVRELVGKYLDELDRKLAPQPEGKPAAAPAKAASNSSGVYARGSRLARAGGGGGRRTRNWLFPGDFSVSDRT